MQEESLLIPKVVAILPFAYFFFSALVMPRFTAIPANFAASVLLYLMVGAPSMRLIDIVDTKKNYETSATITSAEKKAADNFNECFFEKYRIRFQLAYSFEINDVNICAEKALSENKLDIAATTNFKGFIEDFKATNDDPVLRTYLTSNKNKDANKS